MRGRRPDSSKRQNTRLPAIAPGDDAEASSSSLRSDSLPLRSASPLPPRSKSGCWTCRTRKVKCDESRPSCGQCLRLGYACDYNPRLAFRDDTPRIVEKMKESFAVEDSLFDGSSPTEYRPNNSIEDLLPPFAALTTDEERERKAESKTPGTYHVIANPTTFSVSEYKDGHSSQEIRRSSHTPSEHSNEHFRGVKPELLMGGGADPNTVILKSFPEALDTNHSSDPSPRMLSPSRLYPTARTRSNVSNVSSPSSNSSRRGSEITRKVDDAQLLHFYRTAIFPHFTGIGRLEAGEDIFETRARSYPPLYHAILALAALGMANRDGVHRTDALEHYQQVIPALQVAVRSSEDSFSDGALFTHFILWLYEVSAADFRQSNMLQHHSNQLLRIFSLRRQEIAAEPYDFILWTVFTIDIYALLSMAGTGNFAETIREGMLPSPESCLHPPSIYNSEERFQLHVVLKCNQDVVLIALQVGALARSLRSEARQRQKDKMQQETSTRRRKSLDGLQNVIQASQRSWRDQWSTYETCLRGPKPLPPRVFTWIMHSYILFRACAIYIHTSMYPGQINDLDREHESIIRHCCREIIEAAQAIVSQGRFDLQFVVFSLFIAGFASRDQAEKKKVVELIGDYEGHGCGSAKRVRELLENVYRRQWDTRALNGDDSFVDWVEEMESSGERFVLCGL